jgi:hypothetical protein
VHGTLHISQKERAEIAERMAAMADLMTKMRRNEAKSPP